jgi:hypothetical protein
LISSNRTREKGNKGMVVLTREREKRMLWGVKTFLMHLNGVCRLRSAALVWDFKGKDIELWPFFKNVIIALLFEAVILKCRYKGYYWSVDRWYLSSQVCIFEKCRDYIKMVLRLFFRFNYTCLLSCSWKYCCCISLIC